MFTPHKPWYFDKYLPIYDGDQNMVAFEIDNQAYFLDDHGGWADNQGCYYDSECKPQGWFIPDGKDEVEYYNQNKKLVKSYRLKDLDWLFKQEHHRQRRQSAIKQIQILDDLGWNLIKIKI